MAIFPKIPKERARRTGALPYIAVLFGGMIFSAATFLGIDQSDFFEHSQEAILTVVQVEMHTDDDGSPLFRPVFETVTQGGETIRYRSNVSTNPSLHEVGEVVRGRYAPATGELMSYEVMQTATVIHMIFRVIGGALVIWGLYVVSRNLLLARKSR